MFKIGNRLISKESPVYVIAEIGVNHNGSVEMAEKLIKAAHSAGADAVKFQTFKSNKLVSKHAKKASYQLRDPSPGSSQHAMLTKLELDDDQFIRLKKHCDSHGIEFLSTPFDSDSADFLYKTGVKAFKIGSGDLTNIPLLKEISTYGIPIILSTGMANLAEIEDAVLAIENSPIALLHCTSAYPAPMDELNLLAIPALQSAFHLPVGYSDHSDGCEAAIACVALGAQIIEKHITLDRCLPGPDHMASLPPKEFESYVKSIRTITKSLGSGRKQCTSAESEIRDIARKSLTTSVSISKGQILSKEHLVCKRPGTGIPPKYLSKIIGKEAKMDFHEDQTLSWDDIL
ncbi:N-acetylneuraminate synthase [Falsibacillus albus]|uniref:N-acetylneuraminate synthase n=1 Tax=Falsibacillus albus TaxID=2478915 RepID=A0A3L7K2A8_9BACI|nr:N-acetylneuraminate synthase [Falsibacillus albus]RLQ97143.1 N-acetylneuraminate synthase [Falsibacillus albus]